MRKMILFSIIPVFASFLFCEVTFTDISAGLAGINIGSVSWGDYDNDGDLDILLTGDSDSGYISRIYKNDNGIFTNINAGLPGVEYSSAAWGDSDNDGDLDILVTGDTGSDYISRIYKNDNGNFTDINAGLPGVNYSSVAWGDYDNDGDLDILLNGFKIGHIYISKIYRNDSGIFTDIDAGLTVLGGGSVAWGDYDNDGDLDILMTGSNPGSILSKIYRNDAGIFTDINAGLTNVTWSSSVWGDYDNDGDLDILHSGAVSGSLNISKIYRNDSGIFTDINAGLTEVWGSIVAWGDYDNDGDLDMLLAGYTGSIYISKIYRNDAGIFTDINAGLQKLAWGSAKWGDYDNDGDLDILLAGYIGSGRISKIYRNNCVTPNNPPSSPPVVNAVFNNDNIRIDYSGATDIQTPAAGLSYNVEFNFNGVRKTPSMSNLMNGYRKIVQKGNAELNLFYIMKKKVPFPLLPQEEYKHLEVSVQALDNCFSGSEFAVFDSLYATHELSIISKDAMLADDYLSWEYMVPDSLLNYQLQIDTDHAFGSPLSEVIVPAVKNTQKINKAMFYAIKLNELTLFDSLVNSTRYYWRIKPQYSNVLRITKYTEDPLSFVFNSAPTPPNPPISGFNPANDNITGDLPMISWNVATDPDGHAEDLYYICQIDTINTFSTIQYADTTSAGISSVQVVSALPEGYRYYYRIKSIDADALQSAWSAVQNFLIVMPPQNLKIADDGVNVNLSWDAVPINSKGIVYTVYSSPNPNTEFPSGWTVSSAQLMVNSWSEAHTSTKKFYIITVGSSSK